MLVDGGVARDVAFAGSPPRVYVSLYGPAEGSASRGVAVCPTWGPEVALVVDASHRLGAELASRGVACVLHHPPGHLDSPGDARDMSMDDLVTSAAHAAAVLRERFTIEDLTVVGFGLGASVAALAAGDVEAATVFLVEPALDPAAFFADQERTGARAEAMGRGTRDAPFGAPLPREIPGPEAAERVTAAINAHPGRVVALRFSSSGPGTLPGRVEEVQVRGTHAGRWPHRFVPQLVELLQKERP